MKQGRILKSSVTTKRPPPAPLDLRTPSGKPLPY